MPRKKTEKRQPVFIGIVIASLVLLSACSTQGKTNLPTPDSALAATVAAVKTQMVVPNTGQTGGSASSLPTDVQANNNPQIIVRDQDVSGGSVQVQLITSASPGWAVVYAADKMSLVGEVIGYAPMKGGTNESLQIPIDAKKATPLLFVMLHQDVGKIGTYEFPGPDQPLINRGQVVLAAFHNSPAGSTLGQLNQTATATLSSTANKTTVPAQVQTTPIPSTGNPANHISPVIRVSNQAINNGQVVIDEVASNGPGWIVIYTAKNGQPGDAVGYAPVKNGENKNVAVPIDLSKAADTLIAFLHNDAGKVGTFEFPGPDMPVINGLQIVSVPFTTRPQQTASTAVDKPSPAPATAAVSEPFVTVTDQAVHNGMVVIKEAYSVGDSWLVIHPQYPDGSLASYVGYALLHDGLNSNIRVPINTTKAKPTLVAMLHINQSKAKVPQYPGVDMPLMVNDQMIMPAFQIQGSLSGDTMLTNYTDANNSLLADAYGLSLYANINDPAGASKCNGDCLGDFRPLLALGDIHAGQGVDIKKVGFTVRADGSRQVTYGGVPLYYDTQDSKPGEMKGQGAKGGWFIATP